MILTKFLIELNINVEYKLPWFNKLPLYTVVILTNELENRNISGRFPLLAVGSIKKKTDLVPRKCFLRRSTELLCGVLFVDIFKRSFAYL